MRLGVVESSQNVAGDTNSAAVEIEKPADAVGKTLFQKLQYQHPQEFASFPHAVGVEGSVLERLFVSDSVTVGGDLVDVAAEDSEIFGARVDLEKSVKRIDQASDVDTLIANCVMTQD